MLLAEFMAVFYYRTADRSFTLWEYGLSICVKDTINKRAGAGRRHPLQAAF